MTKKDMHLSTLARSFGIMTITVEVSILQNFGQDGQTDICDFRVAFVP